MTDGAIEYPDIWAAVHGERASLIEIVATLGLENPIAVPTAPASNHDLLEPDNDLDTRTIKVVRCTTKRKTTDAKSVVL